LLHLFAFLVGLSLGNHLSTLLLLPGLLYWILVTDHKQLLRPRTLLVMLSLFALGLSVYLYLPLRSAAQPPAIGAMQIQISSWQDIVEVVSARAFWGLFFAYRWSELAKQGADYLYCLWGNFLGVGLVIGALGGIVFAWRRRHLAVGLTLIFLANALFYIGYGAGDKRIMFLPTYVVWAMWIALGLDWFLEQMASWQEGVTGARPLRMAAPMLILGLALAALLVNYQHADLSDDRRTYEQAARVLDTVEPEAYVLATSWFEVAPLEYLHVVEGRRLDVTVLNWNEIDLSDLYNLIDTERGVRPIYSTESVGWLVARYELQYIEECDCYRVR
jgi:hypothetical protein